MKVFGPNLSWHTFHGDHLLVIADVHGVGGAVDLNDDVHAEVGGLGQNVALQGDQSRNAPRCPRRSMEAGRPV